MSNENPKITANVPVDFSIDYNEDGEIQIIIDTDILEARIAKLILDTLEEYNKNNKE